MGIFKIWNQKIFIHIFINCHKLRTRNFSCSKKTLKLLEYTENYFGKSEYVSYKTKLDQLYEEKANGIRIRSKCNWYEYGEK